MSGAFLSTIVLDAVARNPGATADVVMPFVDGYTRDQVVTSLQWLARMKKLRCERQSGLGVKVGGSLPGKYFIVGEYVAKEPARTVTRPAASVWELAKCI
jgi:hypothetical protein